MNIKPIVFIFFLCLPVAAAHAQTIRDVYEQAVASYNSGDYDKAVTLYQALTKESPHFAPAYVGIGLALKAKGADNAEVLYYYKTATEMDPTNTQALEQLGRLYYSMNSFDKAEKVFVKLLKIDPGLREVKLSLAWIYLLYRPRPQLAKKYFLDVLKTNKDPSIYLGLGMAYFANNERVEAIDIVTQLRGMGQNDFAQRLEQAIRENRRVNIDDSANGQDASVSDDAGEEQATATSAAANAPAAPAPADDTLVTPSGVKVRLRGKLSQVD